MSPASTFASLRKDPRFLLRRYLVEHVVLVGILGLSIALRGVDTELVLTPHHALAIPLSIPFGWWVASVIHNAGHGNFSTPLRNRVMGELAGAYLGYGLTNFILIHGLHHAYADRDYDPVSPRGMSFLRFLSGPLRHATRRARRFLDDTHGKSPHYGAVRVGEALLFHANLALRVACIAVLLGPALFLAFYVPSILSDIAILAHINYVCHRDRPDGSVEIVNLDHNLYYRLTNWVTCGGYFHKSHHLRPHLFDPRTFDPGPRPLFTLEPSETPLELRRPRRRGALVRYFDLAHIWGER